LDKAELNKKDPFVPAEKYLTLFSQEWNDYFKAFDDRIIPIIQYFHLKRRDRNPTLNKIIGIFFALIAYLCTCKNIIREIENKITLKKF